MDEGREMSYIDFVDGITDDTRTAIACLRAIASSSCRGRDKEQLTHVAWQAMARVEKILDNRNKRDREARSRT